MPKPDEDHALPSKKAFVISGCPVNCKLYLLAYLHGLSCPFSTYLQYLECLSLCKAPQGYGLHFPPEQWGAVLLSVPCRRDICFWSTPVLSSVLWSKIASGLAFPMLTWPWPSHRSVRIHPSPSPARSAGSKFCCYHPDSPCPLWCQMISKTKQTKAYLGRFRLRLGDWKQKYRKRRTQPSWYLAGYLPRCFCLPCLRVPRCVPSVGAGNTSFTAPTCQPGVG